LFGRAIRVRSYVSAARHERLEQVCVIEEQPTRISWADDNFGSLRRAIPTPLIALFVM